MKCGALVFWAYVILGYDIYYYISATAKVPFLNSGFRMVVFSVIIMVVVLFFRKGLFGDKELSDVFRSIGRIKKGGPCKI